MFSTTKRPTPLGQHQSKKNTFFDQDSDEDISRGSSSKKRGGDIGGGGGGWMSPMHSDRSRSGSSSSRHQDQARSRGSSTHSNKSEKDGLGSLNLIRTMRRPLNSEFNKS